MSLRVAVSRETTPGETRVALVPDGVARLRKAGLSVCLESGAGDAAGYPDRSFEEVGATIAAGARECLAGAGVALKVREPRDLENGAHEADLFPESSVLVCFLRPRRHPGLLEKLAARRITAFSMDQVPRITRAQKMDALSSMSTVAGYRAALLGAQYLGRFFPLLMTAAGTIPPARVFVLGAGVAGLQAIATSRRLGAVVEAFDVRPAVREEVQSLGATFVAWDEAELPALEGAALQDAAGYAKELSADVQSRERELLHRHVKTSDVVIMTAMIPDRPAPVLVTEAMVRDMRPGSVLVDLAAESGGNCELTVPGETVVRHGVTIAGPVNLAASMAAHASYMYSRNLSAFLLHLVREAALVLDFEDPIVRQSCVLRDGKPEAPTAGTPAAAPAAGAVDRSPVVTEGAP